MVIALVLAFLAISFAACSKSNDSTTPPLPNSFEIASLENYGDSFCNASYEVWISFANNTDLPAKLTGKMYFGDGASMDVNEITNDPAGWQLPAKTTQSMMLGRFKHSYAAHGTYEVELVLTANFDNGAITQSLKKKFVL